jgi:hypothetical protein
MIVPEPLAVGKCPSLGTLGYVFSEGKILLAAVVYTSLLLNELLPSFVFEVFLHLASFFLSNLIG